MTCKIKARHHEEELFKQERKFINIFNSVRTNCPMFTDYKPKFEVVITEEYYQTLVNDEAVNFKKNKLSLLWGDEETNKSGKRGHTTSNCHL